MARPSPSCAHDDDRLRLPPASPARNSKAGKKDSTGRRLSQLCPPCATPSSNSSLDYRRSDARIVEDGFAASSGVSKSAKVVLVPVLFFVFAISFTTWPPGPLSMTYFMAVIVWIWARMWGLLYRPIEGLGDELNIVYRKLVKGGPPLVALLFLWGAIDASIDLERVTNPYLVRFKKQDTAELRILLRSFDRGLLMKNAFSNRVEFYQWDDLSTIERRPSATTESLLCYLFGYVCRTKQPPTP